MINDHFVHPLHYSTHSALGVACGTKAIPGDGGRSVGDHECQSESMTVANGKLLMTMLRCVWNK